MFGAIILSMTMAVAGMKASGRMNMIDGLGDERTPQCMVVENERVS